MVLEIQFGCLFWCLLTSWNKCNLMNSNEVKNLKPTASLVCSSNSQNLKTVHLIFIVH